MKTSLAIDHVRLGACYYPEHWPASLWEDDYRRMRELGLSLIRVGEFAWTIFEPQEGVFSFDLFDRALDMAHRHGLRVILGTPTATPPAWLTHRYPEVLNVTRNGVPYQHGQRRHYNYNALLYRELSARIVTTMAEHYKDHPAIIGWQIDNEINCEVNVFYAPADHAAFRAWLRGRYGTLECLNDAWGAVFWNQTYTDWEQVHLTRPTASDSPNPHQSLDEKRFFSDSAIGFVTLQADIVRRVAPHHWITTNGLFGHLDSHRMTEEDGKVRWQAIKTLGTLKDPRAVEPLLTSLRDVDVDARIAAIDALGDIGDLRALPPVQFTALPYRVSLAVGNTKPMSVPRRSPGGGLSAHTRPPCACTTALTMASPSPAPPAPRARRLPR